MKSSLFFLTCANNKEAAKISRALLEKRLVVCVKLLPVSSSFLWKGKIRAAKEVLLMMDSVEENFSKIEKEVKKLHSYKTPVLLLVPARTTNVVNSWIKKELK